MPNILFEPNIHPFVVHFAVAFLLTAPLFLLFSALLPERRSLAIVGDWLLALGVMSAGLAVLAGLQAYGTVNHDGPSHAAMTDHRNWAFITLGAVFLVSLWRLFNRSKAPSVIYAVLLIAVMLLPAFTAWKGARLVYHYGLGVSSLPESSSEGHDHDHVDGHDHGEGEAQIKAEEIADTASVYEARTDFLSLTPAQVIDAFHDALAASDEATVQALLMPDVIIAEGGAVERSFAEYQGHHMPADMEFSKVVSDTLIDRKETITEDLAIIVSEKMTHGTFREREIHSRLMETMVLKKTDSGWRIAHIHWSSMQVSEDHEH